MNNNSNLEQKQCIHFKSCGGCAYRDISYKNQISLKKNEIELFLKENKFPYDNDFEIIPSKELDYYRNKMEFTFAVWDDALVLGMHEKNKFYKIIDLQECYLFNPMTSVILNIVRDWAKKNNITAYHKKRHTGTLRHLVIRDTKNNGAGIMIHLMAKEKLDTHELVLELQKQIPNFKSFYFSVNTKKADVALGDEIFHIYGDTELIEEIGGNKYLIGPYTFFQINSRQVEILYNIVKEWLGNGKILFDLYCGVGGFALHLSSNFEKVIGIEINLESINYANKNAELNKIKNCAFIQGEVEKVWEPFYLDNKNTSVIVDPPRSGLHKKTIDTLKNIKPMQIAYVSCNYKTMINNILELSEYYFVDRFCAIDMFPHTIHTECIALLKLKY